MQYGLYLGIFTAMSLFKVYAHTSASSKTIQFKFTGTKSNRTVFAEPACYQPRLFEHPLRGLLVFLSLLSQRQLCCSDASNISLIIAFIWLFPQKDACFFEIPKERRLCLRHSKRRIIGGHCPSDVEWRAQMTPAFFLQTGKGHGFSRFSGKRNAVCYACRSCGPTSVPPNFFVFPIPVLSSHSLHVARQSRSTGAVG